MFRTEKMSLEHVTGHDLIRGNKYQCTATKWFGTVLGSAKYVSEHEQRKMQDPRFSNLHGQRLPGSGKRGGLLAKKKRKTLIKWMANTNCG
jgi:hypothetical protein